jgi:uncharacterized protein (TIGR02145 family)
LQFKFTYLRKYSILALFSLFIINVHAQDYIISFSGSGASNAVDAVKVENLNQEIMVDLSGAQVLHLINGYSLQKENIVKKSTGIQKSNLAEVKMRYNKGDRLKITGISGNYSTIFMDTPNQDKKLTFNFVACTDSSLYSYPVVQIGTQTWMAKNLKTIKLNDGTAIPYGYRSYYFSSTYKPGYSFYKNSDYYGDIYGTLYDWELVWTKKLCPKGWHVPSIDEWATLFNSIGGENIAGDILKEKGNIHWESPNEGAIDSVGFCALPGGANYNELVGSNDLGIAGYWWTANTNVSNMTEAYYVAMFNDSSKVIFGTFLKNISSSVRCVDNTVFPSFRSENNITICKGSAYNGWDAEGQYAEKFTSIAGYDSIVITNLSFYKTPSPEISVQEDTLISLNSYFTYQWYDKNGEIQGADKNKYIVNNSGQYYLITTDANGCKNTSRSVNVSLTNVVQNSLDDFKYSIIPNPNNGKFGFRIDTNLNDDLTLKLINSLGQIVEIRIIKTGITNHIEQFDLSNFSQGIYHLIIINGTHKKSEKIVVQKY